MQNESEIATSIIGTNLTLLVGEIDFSEQQKPAEKMLNSSELGFS